MTMKTKILLDMDGVLTDFMGAAAWAHDKYIENLYEPSTERRFCDAAEVLYLTPKEFWSKISTFEFWDQMKWTPDGKSILSLLEKRYGKENICLCTSPSLEPQAAAGKMSWIFREMPNYSRRFLIGPSKEFCASPQSILIDDTYSNIAKFIDAGGRGVLVPRCWNESHGLGALQFLTVAFSVGGTTSWS